MFFKVEEELISNSAQAHLDFLNLKPLELNVVSPECTLSSTSATTEGTDRRFENLQDKGFILNIKCCDLTVNLLLLGS
jgi:hypothetical protein